MGKELSGGCRFDFALLNRIKLFQLNLLQFHMHSARDRDNLVHKPMIHHAIKGGHSFQEKVDGLPSVPRHRKQH
ncbi:hypothetical protein PHISCL_11235 [Aspergillus sclerotialis]|uniref:Uncharacterized protein n=1 Tax=Aspergillus sclerotialis TaxID=2070753 RepID=A0A3A2YZV3_9EURO|nr:hypothetical protein PHISCL_11235 [Aspergillus sclerotialis]